MKCRLNVKMFLSVNILVDFNFFFLFQIPVVVTS